MSDDEEAAPATLALAAAIKTVREDAGLSQAELARRTTAHPGRTVEQWTISRLEAGEFEPRPSQVQTLEDALGIPHGTIYLRAGLVQCDVEKQLAELDQGQRHTVMTLIDLLVSQRH